jgi:hypothetical protein
MPVAPIQKHANTGHDCYICHIKYSCTKRADSNVQEIGYSAVKENPVNQISDPAAKNE